MAIEGPLKELGIHDVFQLLDLSKKTGVLRVTSQLRRNQGAVWLQSGSVIYAEIRSNPHPLGELLVRSGKVAEADLRQARTQQEHGDSRKIGEILISVGAITAGELERQVRFQVEEVIFEMMSWHEGYFSFEEDDQSVPGDASTRIRTEALLMEGARRIDEWSRMERKIPHVGVVPALTAAVAGEEGELDLLPTEWELLAMIDGLRDVRGIAKSLSKSEFDVARTIFGMESAGIVTILARRSSSHPVIIEEDTTDQRIAEAEGALRERDLEGARSVIEMALSDQPHDARLLLTMGRVHLAAERAEDAEETLRRALRLDSSMALGHRLLGDALARQGRLKEASAWWGHWLQLNEETDAEDATTEHVQSAIKAAQTLDAFLKA